MINSFVGNWTPESRAVYTDMCWFIKSELIDKKIMTLQRGSLDITKNYKTHTRMWEYSMAIAHTLPINGKKVLDVGGAASLLSLYAAYCGAKVVSTDLLQENVNKSTKICNKLNIENISAYNKDISKQDLGEQFDVIYNINVFEHIAEHKRAEDSKFKPGQDSYWGPKYKQSPKEVEAEKLFLTGMVNHLKPGGKLVLTFDYAQFAGFKSQKKCAHLRNEEDIQKRIIDVVDLPLYGKSMEIKQGDSASTFWNKASTVILFFVKE